MLIIPIENGDKKVRSRSFLYLITLALINQYKYWFSALIKIFFVALIISHPNIFSNHELLSVQTSNSGLPVNWVYSLAIDHSNNKWIGAYWNGLVKYEGNNWTTYNLCLAKIIQHYDNNKINYVKIVSYDPRKI